MKESIGLNSPPRLRSSCARTQIHSRRRIRDFETAELQSGRLDGHLVLRRFTQMIAFDNQPIDEHGYRAVSRSNLCELDSGAATRAKDM